MTALALYPPHKDATTAGDRNVLALVGMLATAAALDLLTFFRADATHFVGMSLALAPMMVLGIVYLPSRVFATRRRQVRSRVLLIAVFLIVYPFLSANTEFRFANVGRAVEGVRIARALWHGAPTNASATLLPRLGYQPAPDEGCCRANKLTYADLALVMKDVHAAAAGRTVLVDTRDKYSALGPVASAVYFLGDLRVGTTFIEPMMSIWTDADVAAAEREADRIKPECLLTGGEDFLLTEHVLRSFGAYATHKVSGPVVAVLHCRSHPTT
ncbi:MAG: hypothetical protein M3Z05_12415 [Gemmatimonadota bacterium]|nr:hypothetical protein [Gemmatimonadota bacterium]